MSFIDERSLFEGQSIYLISKGTLICMVAIICMVVFTWRWSLTKVRLYLKYLSTVPTFKERGKNILKLVFCTLKPYNGVSSKAEILIFTGGGVFYHTTHQKQYIYLKIRTNLWISQKVMWKWNINTHEDV